MPHELDDDSKQRIVKSIEKSRNVPQYIRRAVKALEKVVVTVECDIIDADFLGENKELTVKTLLLDGEIIEHTVTQNK